MTWMMTKMMLEVKPKTNFYNPQAGELLRQRRLMPASTEHEHA